MWRWRRTSRSGSRERAWDKRSGCRPTPPEQLIESAVIGRTRLMTRISPSFRWMTRRALLAAFVLAPVASLAAEIARRAEPPIALSFVDRADLKRIAVYLDGI